MGEIIAADQSVLENMQASMKLSDDEDEPVDDIIFVSSESNDLPTPPSVTPPVVIADATSDDHNDSDAANSAHQASAVVSASSNAAFALADTSNTSSAGQLSDDTTAPSSNKPSATPREPEAADGELVDVADDPVDVVPLVRELEPSSSAAAVVPVPDKQVVVLKEDLAGTTDDDDEFDDDDFEDETLLERLAGLSEMFPDSVQRGGASLFRSSVSGVKSLYSLFCSGSWIFFSSATILLAPVMFEVERCQMDEMHKQQQRQILLGPNAAVSGSGMVGPPMR